MTRCDVPLSLSLSLSLSLCMRALPTFFPSEPRASTRCYANLGPIQVAVYRNCTGSCVSKFIYSATPIDAARFPRTMLMPGHTNSSVRNCLPLSLSLSLSLSPNFLPPKRSPLRIHPLVNHPFYSPGFRPSRSRLPFIYACIFF